MKKFNSRSSRSTASIVQQINVCCTRDVVRDFFAGRPVDVNPGATPPSYDFEDGVVDWDAPYIEEADNIIDQSFKASVYMEHLHPSAAPDEEATPLPQEPVQSE